MNFYCIVNSKNAIHNIECYEFLQKACHNRGIHFETLETEKVDYSQDLQKLLAPNSLLYKLSLGRRAAMLQTLVARADTATLYKNQAVMFELGFAWGSVIKMKRAGLPIIPTIFNVHGSTPVAVLQKYVNALGGFPLILKSSGGSHGSGVMKIDSLESLRSVLGFVSDDTSAKFVLRKFIPSAVHIRCVVVADDAVDAVRYLPQKGDFRTNAVYTPQVEPYKRNADTDHIFVLAQKAVAVQGVELGGVDILIDAAGKPYVAEVNFPCNFARNQLNTGKDIAGMIVDYLRNKLA